MTEFHRYATYVYVTWIGTAALLTIFNRRLNKKTNPGSVQKKSLPYILINLAFMAAIWLPQNWRLLTIMLTFVGAFCTWELSRALLLPAFSAFYYSFICASLILVSDFLEPADFWKYWLLIFLIACILTSITASVENIGRYFIGSLGAGIYFPLCLAAYVWLWHVDNTGIYNTFAKSIGE